MKKILIPYILLITLFAISFYTQAETHIFDPEKKTQNIIYGDKYFSVEDYFLAAEYYRKELEKHPDNPYAAFKLAECYRMFFDYKDAEIWYGRANQLAGDLFPLATFYHALMLKTNGKYYDASKEFEDFIANYEKQGEHDDIPEQATLHYNGCLLALEAFTEPLRDFRFHNPGAPLNTEHSEFAPAIYENDTSLVIASSRIESEDDAIYGRLGGAFLDNFRFEQQDSLQWKLMPLDSAIDGFGVVNTKFNDGAGSFTADKKKYYFTRCDEVIPGNEGYNCAIYVTEKAANGKWTPPVHLPESINMKGEWNAQPAISPKGDSLFFVSKRPGGYGQHDIYLSVFNKASGEWSVSKNLGAKVNTKYAEISPQYYPKEKVLFFASNGHEGFGGLDIFIAKGKGFSTVRNIGLPFNSNRDDFSIALGDSLGYLSSNREKGFGNDDIYKFTIRSREALLATIRKDDTPSSGTISIRGKVIDMNNKPKQGITVMLTDVLGKVLKTTETDEEGVFVFASLDPNRDYRVVMEDNGDLLTQQKNYKATDIEVYASDKPLNTKSLQMAGMGVASRVPFENIYFDFNKAQLRPEAVKVLDELIAFVKENHALKIEISAHTDAIGSKEYNALLSEQRGTAAYRYLVTHGLKGSHIIVNAVGEGNPIATNDNEAGRQLNRRIEFSIVSGGKYEPKTMVYIVEPAKSLDEVAVQFNMSVKELKELNNLEHENLKAYAPLRVKRSSHDDDLIAPVSATFKDEKHEEQVDPSASKEYLTQNREKHETFVPFNTGYNAGVKYYKYDGSGYYTVLPKNTLFSIAKICSTSVDKIKSLNNLKTNDVTPGTRLRITEEVEHKESHEHDYTKTASMADAGISVSSQKGKVVLVQGEYRYVIAEGDSYYAIAKKLDVSITEMMKLNEYQKDDLHPGAALKLPAGYKPK